MVYSPNFMNTRRFILRLRETGQTGLAAALVLLILFAGFQSFATTPEPENTVPAVFGDDYICDYPVLPDVSGGQGMTDDGRPYRGGSDHWILPLIIKTDNSGKRLFQKDLARLGARVEIIDSWNRQCLVTSTSLVSSCLGRQFTLVGAKPSGKG